MTMTINLIDLETPLAIVLQNVKNTLSRKKSPVSKKVNAQIIALAPNALVIKGGARELKQNGSLAWVLRFCQSSQDFFSGSMTLKSIVPFAHQGKSAFLAEIAGKKNQEKLGEVLTFVRKNQHIDLCAGGNVEESQRFTGFDDFMLLPRSLPELNWSDIDTTASLLGSDFSLPFLITGMTGGVEKAETINLRLAHAAAAMNIPMGVGSQRLALESPKYARIFKLKDRIQGSLFLLGNVGISQLLKSSDPLSLAQRAVDMIDADALAIHVNVLQELVQVEGDVQFKGAYKIIEKLVKGLSCPVLVKEVGSGFDGETINRLSGIGVQAIDIGGRGGTSWPYIEGQRSLVPMQQNLGTLFRDWGIPTAYSLRDAVKITKNASVDLVATGGIRNGFMACIALGLGANMTGIGLPLLKAALEKEEGPLRFLEEMARQLKIVLMATGSANIKGLASRIHQRRSFYGQEI